MKFLVMMKCNQSCRRDTYKSLDFLKEFLDNVSNNVPGRLLPLRKISHQIDLILGAHLPNKETHRMTQTKSEELNRQVQELLQEGLIQESLGACVVLEVLALN